MTEPMTISHVHALTGEQSNCSTRAFSRFSLSSQSLLSPSLGYEWTVLIEKIPQEWSLFSILNLDDRPQNSIISMLESK